jgi:hypothetical protein
MISSKRGISEITTMTAITGRRYPSIPGMKAPSAYPASTSPTVKTSPPTHCYTMKVTVGVRRAPASGLSIVRTTGTNRASTMAFAGP